MPRSKSDLRKIKKSICEHLDTEAVRLAFLKCALNDEEFSQDNYEEAKIMVELSREHFGHSEPFQTPEDQLNSDAGIRASV